MSCKVLLMSCAVIGIFGLLEAASFHVGAKNANKALEKLDYESVYANVRNARQTYLDNDSGEDSDEDDDDDEDDADAELQHQMALRRQQAYEQSIDDSQGNSDEDGEDNFEEDDDYYGRRLRRAAAEPVDNNEIEETAKPTKNTQPATENNAATLSNPGTSNTSVLILIRDAIKKVTEIPNTQQVATSAQQYFQLFQHFLQQTIEQVIGDDDDDEEDEAEAESEIEVESTTIASEPEKESVTEAIEMSEKPADANETSDKESSEQEMPKPEKETQEEAVDI